ncbi:MAG: hypothetical protein ACLUAG_01530 [Lachnospiraceae bacterium]
MSKIISTGSTFRIYGDDLVTHNQLPAQIYSIRCSKMTGFYLEKHCCDLRSMKIKYTVCTWKK